MGHHVGGRMSVLGVTCGTQHRCPGLVSALPQGLRKVVRRLTGRLWAGPDVITTVVPELVVWVRHDATNASALSGSLRFALGDESGQFAGQAETLNDHGTWTDSGTLGFALPDGTARITHSRAADDAQNHATLEVTFEDLANPSNRWEVTSVVLADATGNVATNGSLGSSSFGSGVGHFVFGPCLWPSEIWDLTLTAGRRAGSGFGAAELVQFTGVPWPAVGEVGQPDRTLRSGDTTVTLTSMQRRAPLADSEHGSGTQLSQVALQVSGLPADHRFTLVQATDDRGRVLEVSQSSWGSAEPHEATFRFRSIERDAQTLDLQFAVHRLVAFTFRVRPDLATTNDFTPGRL